MSLKIYNRLGNLVNSFRTDLVTKCVTRSVLVFIFLSNSLACPYAVAGDLFLPSPGTMVRLSPEFNPPVLKGIRVHPDNPFKFEFILDRGDIVGAGHALPLRDDVNRLIKYFLASITTPDKDLWVNLSPYEKAKIIPQSFGLTEMGRDLLAEDYMLKQITASLIYPEDDIGKKFWKRVYTEARVKYGTTDIPVNTFNKVWIVPQKAVVYENSKTGTAYVLESKLKVMLEQDYLALEKNQRQPGDMFKSEQPRTCPQAGCRANQPLNVKASQVNPSTPNDMNALGSNIIRDIVLPELTREVNENKNFSQLRQVYNSLILAAWYKKKIKDSILSQVYADKKKIAGVGYGLSDVEIIYQRYLQAFKKGVFNYIKEEANSDVVAGNVMPLLIPRKYFSGGFDLAMSVNLQITTKIDRSQLASGNLVLVSSQVDMAQRAVIVPPIHGTKFSSFQVMIAGYPDLAQNLLYNMALWNDLQAVDKISRKYPGFNLRFAKFDNKNNEELGNALKDFIKGLGGSYLDVERYFSFFSLEKLNGEDALRKFLDEISDNAPFYLKALERVYKPALEDEPGFNKEEAQEYMALLKTIIDRWKEGEDLITLGQGSGQSEVVKEEDNPFLRPEKKTGIVSKKAASPKAVQMKSKTVVTAKKSLEPIKLSPVVLKPEPVKAVSPLLVDRVKSVKSLKGNELLGFLFNNPMGLAIKVTEILNDGAEASLKYDYVEAELLGSGRKERVLDYSGSKAYSNKTGTSVYFPDNRSVTVRKDFNEGKMVVDVKGWENSGDVAKKIKRGLGIDSAQLSHVNPLNIKAYVLPQEIFNASLVNLMNVFGLAWKNFVRDQAVDPRAKVTIQPRGSVNYAINEKGNLDWGSISNFEFAVYLPDHLSTMQRRVFQDKFGVDYVHDAMTQMGLKTEYVPERKLCLIGQLNGKERKWEIVKYMQSFSRDRLIEAPQGPSWDMYFYEPTANYFEMSSDGKARVADLSFYLEDLPLKYLVENLMLEFQGVYKEALGMFKENNPKAFKRLAVASRLIGNEGMFRRMMVKFREASLRGWIFKKSDDPFSLGFTEDAQMLGLNQGQLCSEIEGFVINRFQLNIFRASLSELIHVKGDALKLGPLFHLTDSAMNSTKSNKDEPVVHLPEGLVNAQDVTAFFPKSRKILHPDEGGIFKYILGDRNPFVADLSRSMGDHIATIDRDAAGRPYYFINFNEYAIRVLGYNRPELKKALARNIYEVVNRMAYSDFITTAYAVYVKMMMSIRPKGLDHIFVANTGAEANENAFKALKLGRPKSQFIIAFGGAYHGRTPGALSVTAKTKARKGLFKFPWSWISFPELKREEDAAALDAREKNSLAEVWTLMVRGKTRGKGESLAIMEEKTFKEVLLDLDQLIEKYNNLQLNATEVSKAIQDLKGRLSPDLFKESENVTGFIAEPYQGEGGMKFASARFFQRLRCLTALFDVPLIFDEVQSGFFVTGTTWAYEAFDLPIPPDIVTFSKKAQMGGMYVSDRYYVNESGKLDSTWGGSDSGIIRAVAYEEIIRKEGLVQRARELGAYSLEKLREVEKRHPALNLNTRGWGLVLALDLPNETLRDQVVEAAWRRGLIINLAGSRTIRILPCFDTKVSTIDEAFKILEEAIVQVAGEQQVPKDSAMLDQGKGIKENGGIDLRTDLITKSVTRSVYGGIKFHLDPAMLLALQNAPGFVPVIINIQPLESLSEFLGLID